MRFFSALYKKMLLWAKHPYAPYYLFGLSFAESSVFPIPPDVMLAPMALASPHRAWWYATITTVSSVLGGVFGYFIGMYFIEITHPILIELGYAETYQHVVSWFNSWGFWLIFVAGFAPIPYKLFTIAAGATGMAMFPFVIGSFIGRGGRFFLVAGLMLWGGERMQQLLHRYIDYIGWTVVGVLILVYIAVHLIK